MKEDELRQYATCAICKQPVGYSGLPMLWKLTVERRMCEALGIDPPQRKRYYRPCVDPEIGEVIKDMGIDVNAVLLEYLAARDALP